MSRTFPNTVLKVVKVLECDICHAVINSEPMMSEHIQEHYLEDAKIKVTRNRSVNKSVMDAKIIKKKYAPNIDFEKITKHNITASRYILCGINGCGIKCTSVKKLNQHKKQFHSY